MTDITLYYSSVESPMIVSMDSWKFISMRTNLLVLREKQTVDKANRSNSCMGLV